MAIQGLDGCVRELLGIPHCAYSQDLDDLKNLKNQIKAKSIDPDRDRELCPKMLFCKNIISQ